MVRSALPLFVAVLLVASSAAAQQGGSSIRGRVTDSQQAVLPGVSIIVTHQESGTVRETITSADGGFLVPGLVPGPYRITAELQGFRRLIQSDVVLRIGTTLQVDLLMQVGGLEESVTVTADTPQVDLTSVQVGGNVSSGELTDLPSSSRNFTGLIALLPGVVYNAASDSSSDSVTINGQHGSGVVFLMDGGSNNDDLRGGSSGAQARPPLESIQEFQVVTNQFDAEYGAATAGVVNAVTKQGSNTWRGSAFGYFTDGSMTAKDFFVEQQNLDKPETRKNQWGRTIGGPIFATGCISSRASSGRTVTKGAAATIRRVPIAAFRLRKRPTRGTTWDGSIIRSTRRRTTRSATCGTTNRTTTRCWATALSIRSASRKTTIGRSWPPTTACSAAPR